MYILLQISQAIQVSESFFYLSEYVSLPKSLLIDVFPRSVAFNRLLTCLEQIRSKLDSGQDDLLLLYEYFRQPERKVRMGDGVGT